MSDLQDKVYVITGGAGGIARGIAEAILERGGRVALFDLDQAKVSAAAAALEVRDRAMSAVANVTDLDSLKAAFGDVERRMGRLDGLVNNAGIVRLGPADETTPDGLDLELAVNVKGVLLASQVAATHFGDGGGSIVNIASNAGKVGYRNMAGYNASKAAVINLTRSLSLEWAEKRINVNAVCPGGVATDMLKSVADFLAPRLGQDKGALFDTMYPAQLGRHIQPIEVGRVVAFLLSDAATIIRGQSINIDGGDTPY
ncbi:SDR family oxidoreductase [Nitratireductor mangrovi]|uniref:SDR family oxidoreductase n=1 Tax=Nitratireductor mangrovi TaxID=2599600 RepID=A0A5B8L352_9HYPH|nr:SDR family oxidoreductase [Nitratireductor mangrovi]QDZ02273.1 SDR family oxidoreductase [Nitratireductor mangrovi]